MAKRPDAGRRAVNQLMLSGEGMQGLAQVCRLIGLDYAFRLFDFISPENRAILESSIRQSFDGDLKDPKGRASDSLMRVIERFEQEALQEPVEGAPLFGFLEKWDDKKLTDAMEIVSAEELALMAPFVAPTCIHRLLGLMDTPKRAAMILALGRVASLPPHSISSAAYRLGEKLISHQRRRIEPVETVADHESEAWIHVLEANLDAASESATETLIADLKRLQQEQSVLESDWEWDSQEDASDRPRFFSNPSKLMS